MSFLHKLLPDIGVDDHHTQGHLHSSHTSIGANDHQEHQYVRVIDTTSYGGLTNTAYSATAGSVTQLEVSSFTYRGGLVVVFLSGFTNNTTAGSSVFLSYEVRRVSDSASIQASSDSRAIQNASGRQLLFSYANQDNSMSNGTEYKIRMQHRVTADTGTINDRQITIIEFP